MRFLADESCDVARTKDFGLLAYAGGHETSGVVSIRYPAETRSSLGAAVVKLVTEAADRISGAFVVTNQDVLACRGRERWSDRSGARYLWRHLCRGHRRRNDQRHHERVHVRNDDDACCDRVRIALGPSSYRDSRGIDKRRAASRRRSS